MNSTSTRRRRRSTRSSRRRRKVCCRPRGHRFGRSADVGKRPTIEVSDGPPRECAEEFGTLCFDGAAKSTGPVAVPSPLPRSLLDVLLDPCVSLGTIIIVATATAAVVELGASIQEIQRCSRKVERLPRHPTPRGFERTRGERR